MKLATKYLIEAMGRVTTGAARLRITAYIRKCFNMCIFVCNDGHSLTG